MPRTACSTVVSLAGRVAPALLLLAVFLPLVSVEAQAQPAATRPSGVARPGLRGSAGTPAVPTLGTGPTASFDATVYDVRVPADAIGRLDVDALGKAAATAEEFEKALAALGAAKPLYRASQSIRLAGDTIVIGSEVPVVTNSRQTDRGGRINTVQYMSHGAIFSVVGNADASGKMDLDVTIQVSAATEDGAPISDQGNAAVMRRATLLHKAAVQPRKPFLVLSADAASTDKDGKAIAYIGRITIGEPQQPASQ